MAFFRLLQNVIAIEQNATVVVRILIQTQNR